MEFRFQPAVGWPNSILGGAPVSLPDRFFAFELNKARPKPRASALKSIRLLKSISFYDDPRDDVCDAYDSTFLFYAIF
jgi:hypothetical protein